MEGFSGLRVSQYDNRNSRRAENISEQDREKYRYCITEGHANGLTHDEIRQNIEEVANRPVPR